MFHLNLIYDEHVTYRAYKPFCQMGKLLCYNTVNGDFQTDT